jgi:hypothetical protein
MIGHDAYDVADDRSRVAAGQVEKAVLFGKARDPRLGVLENESKPVQSAAGIGSQRL